MMMVIPGPMIMVMRTMMVTSGRVLFFGQLAHDVYIQEWNNIMGEYSSIHEKNKFCGGDGFFGKKKLAENLA